MALSHADQKPVEHAKVRFRIGRREKKQRLINIGDLRPHEAVPSRQYPHDISFEVKLIGYVKLNVIAHKGLETQPAENAGCPARPDIVSVMDVVEAGNSLYYLTGRHMTGLCLKKPSSTANLPFNY
jgi:hypothetical protein